MNQFQTQATSPAFEDPRYRSDFRAEYYPKANGREAPPLEASGRNDHFILEFLAAYYDLNRQYAALLQVRKEPKSAGQACAESENLRAIEKILIARDRLEDRYAPFGVIAEPLIERGFTVDVTFSFGNVDARGRPRSEGIKITVYVPIPLPPGTGFGGLPTKIEGPGLPSE